MLSIPKTPCPVGGLVPWMAQLCPIKAKKPHPVYGWVYTIHEKRKEMGLVIWANVSQEEIVQEMDRFASFKPGVDVQIGAWNTRKVLARKWDFEKGTMIYTVSGSREGKHWTMDQEQLLARINAATEEHA